MAKTRNLLLTTILAGFVLILPATAATVTFCGPKPQGKCDIKNPDQHNFPEVGEGPANVILFRSVDPSSPFATLPYFYGFKELQFSFSTLYDFEIIVNGHVKKEKPKSGAFFQYSVVADYPMTEVELFAPDAPAMGLTFGSRGSYPYNIGGIIPLPSIWATDAIATPELSTWAMGLIGFGILGAIGYRRSIHDRRI